MRDETVGAAPREMMNAVDDGRRRRMHGGRQIARFGVLLLVLGLLPAPGVGAEGEELECTSGPAHAASADRPHRVDPEGDIGTLVTINGDPVGPRPDLPAFDLRTVWVGVEETAPGSRIPRYTINATVTSLAEHPVGAVYYLGVDPYTWASAAALPDGSWEFGIGGYSAVASGMPIVFARRSATDGSVDAGASSIRIVIPDAELPGATTRPYAYAGLRGGIGHTASADGGVASQESFVSIDTTGGTPACTAVLDGLAPADPTGS